MTPEQRRRYQEALHQHLGQMVAVDVAEDGSHNIVAAAPTMAELQKQLGPYPDAMILEAEDIPPGQALILGVA
ncbi:MAG: hypothetical protein ACHQE6_04075 [Solirubrobacterales bacterium]